MCPILIGLFICVLFSQGKIYVSYSHRALHLCPAGQNLCVLFSQGSSFVSYSHRAKIMCPILTGDKDEQMRPILTGLFICVLFSQG